jgi:3-oxoacyl-[acyl-carrier protein] reductase
MTQQPDAKPARRALPPRVVAPAPVVKGGADLSKKVAVVVGGARGTGGVIAQLLASSGASVAVVGRDEAAVGGVAQAITKAGGKALPVTADLTKVVSMGDARKQIEKEFGPVDVLVVCGARAGRPVRVARMAPKGWRTAVEANLTSAFIAMRQFLPGMTARGHGSVVIVASAAGRAPGLANAAFAAANAGLVMLTRQAALEVARRDVRVNCIAYGGVLTEQLEQRVPEQRRNRLAASIPLGRLGSQDDIAGAAAYLASDAAAWVTGAVIDVTGGKVMG